MARERVAIVTGGGGRLGSLVSARLVESGQVDQVLSLDVTHASAPKVDHVAQFELDVSDREAVRALMKSEVTDAGRTVRVIVNCLGISPKAADGSKVAIPDITTEDWDRVFRVNVLAPLVVIQEAWESLMRDEAAIVNVLSIVGKVGSGGALGSRHGMPSPAGAHYGASKAALANLTLSLARELGPMGIRVNGVSPGHIEGGMQGSARSADLDRMVEEIPLGRYAYYEEIVDAIEFLTSQKSSYVSGELLDVNGAWYAD